MTFASAKTVLNVMNDAALYTCLVPAQCATIIIPFQSGKIKKNEWNDRAAAGVNAFMNVSGIKKEPHALILAFACGPEKMFVCYLPVVTFR